ncbi:MAG: hypothetical protein ACK2UA_01490 [Anaerolineae bacterium]|jgi:hypothetical protein
MAERQHILRWGGACGLLAALILTAMMVVGLAAGPNSTEMLQPTDPAKISDLLSGYGSVVKASIVLDDLFVLAYTGAFLGLAALVWPRSRWLAGIAMVFALATAVLDFAENARLMTMALGIGSEANLTGSALRELNIITQLKYAASHLAVFLFGVGLVRRDLLSWTVTAFLFTFAVVSTIAFAYSAVGLVRILLMWLLLVLGGWLAWRESKTMEGEH